MEKNSWEINEWARGDPERKVLEEWQCRGGSGVLETVSWYN